MRLTTRHLRRAALAVAATMTALAAVDARGEPALGGPAALAGVPAAGEATAARRDGGRARRGRRRRATRSRPGGARPRRAAAHCARASSCLGRARITLHSRAARPRRRRVASSRPSGARPRRRRRRRTARERRVVSAEPAQLFTRARMEPAGRRSAPVRGHAARHDRLRRPHADPHPRRRPRPELPLDQRREGDAARRAHPRRPRPQRCATTSAPCSPR